MGQLRFKHVFISDYCKHNEDVVLAIRGCKQVVGRSININEDEAKQIINHLTEVFNLQVATGKEVNNESTSINT